MGCLTDTGRPVVVVIANDPIELRQIEADLSSMSFVRARAILCATIERAIQVVQAVMLFVLLDDHLGPIDRAEDSIRRFREVGCSIRIVVMSCSIIGRRQQTLMALGCFEVIEKDEPSPDSLEMPLVMVNHMQPRRLEVRSGTDVRNGAKRNKMLQVVTIFTG